MAVLRVMIMALLALAGGAGVHAYDITQVDLGRGPVNVFVPDDYSTQTPVPLVLLLHGYSSSGFFQELYMEFRPLVDRYGFIYLYPNGTRDSLGNRFWNATRACCDFDESQEDDSGYLRALINELTTIFSIDPERVFLVGHSNGGFMANRMACEHSDIITGIAGFAGAAFLDPDDCRPEHPVHVLQIHGTNDDLIEYDGGCLTPARCYPGAEETVEQWVVHNRCLPVFDDSIPPLDLVSGLPGAETTIRSNRDCPSGGSSELWTINGGGHVPPFNDNFSRSIVDHLISITTPEPPARMRRYSGVAQQPRTRR
jgi:polyhydroxybutyrate depolymerase